ncbi:MAG: nitroreductase family protein [Halobacteriota archaeon]
MERTANNTYPIHELIKKRWSPRAFAEHPVEHDKLLSLFEAARWAPSSLNAQPWSFILATKEDEEGFNRLLGCLPEKNQRWARGAPALVLSVAQLYLQTGKPDRLAFYGVGLAVENLAIQATALGLYAHQMGGINEKDVRKAFSIPEGYEPVDMIAVGYLGDPRSLPDDLREQERAPRERKSLEQFVFSKRWGNVSPIIRK